MAPLHARTVSHAHGTGDTAVGVVIGVIAVGAFLYLLRRRAGRDRSPVDAEK